MKTPYPLSYIYIKNIIKRKKKVRFLFLEIIVKMKGKQNQVEIKYIKNIGSKYQFT